MVRCDYCGCAFTPDIQVEFADGIKYMFFRCDYCGKAYMILRTEEINEQTL